MSHCGFGMEIQWEVSRKVGISARGHFACNRQIFDQPEANGGRGWDNRENAKGVEPASDNTDVVLVHLLSFIVTKAMIYIRSTSLPEEPAADHENVVTLLVKMPDGSRHGRRFLKTDRLQSLFDFIDVGRRLKPGTYIVVRPFPRPAFSDGESTSTLTKLSLTSKQEALFMELLLDNTSRNF